MKPFDRIEGTDESWVSITWQVSDWCNFKCSYCADFSNGGKNKNNFKIDKSLYNFEQLIVALKAENYRYFKFNITGGEPTYWNNLLNIVQKFKELLPYKGNFISLNTNLSRDIEWWKKNYSNFDEVIASYHVEYTDTEQYVSTLKFLNDKLSCVPRIMMKAGYFDQCKVVVNKIKDNLGNYDMELAPVKSEESNKEKLIDYTKQELDFLSHYSRFRKCTSYRHPIKHTRSCVVRNYEREDININNIIVQKLNSFKNWQCNVHENIYIKPNGEIQQSTCGQGSVIGNIFDKIDYSRLINPVICKKDFCPCGADIHNTKFIKEENGSN